LTISSRGKCSSFVFRLGDYDFAKNVLDSLDHQRANIAHWNRRGAFARQYVELLIAFDRIRHGQVGDRDFSFLFE